MMEIKDKQGNVRASVEITDKSVYVNTLMEEEYVLLSFKSDTLIAFAKKDSVETEFGTFYIMEIDKPERQSDGSYKYEQKFHAEWCFMKNHILFYDRGTSYESSWKLTQRPEYFLDIVVSNLTRLGYTGYAADVDSSFDEMKLVEFDAASITDALTLIAEAWETDWWIDGKTIHLRKCEIGTPIELTEGDEVAKVSVNDGDESAYMTRAYVFGSTRNLPGDYRKSETGTMVNGNAEVRLKLPSGTPYIDAWENLKDEDVVEGVIVLDDVYPRNVGTMSTISTHEYTDTTENEDGTKTETKWNAYRYTDSDLAKKGFKEEYRIDGEELRIVFQTGKLAGMDFAVNFNPDKVSEEKPGAQVFEIVRNDDYGVNLPSDDFHPEVGDTYILYGYNTKFVYDSLVSVAEQELLTKGTAKLADYSKDKSVYNITANVIRCAGYTEDGNYNLVHRAADEIDMTLGQAVTLKSSAIGGGSVTSRVRSFEKRLDNKFNATYVIGESSAYSKSGDLQDKVEQLTYQSKQYVSAVGNSIYVVKRYDTTTPSDTNVLSALRSLRTFLRKDSPDSTEHLTQFFGGVYIGDYISGLYSGTGAAVDKNGNGEFESVRVRSYLEVMELIVNRLSAIEGDQLLTESDTIESVDDLGDNCYGLHLKSKWDGYFTAQAVNNVLKGIVNTLAEGSGTYHTSWMRVNSVNTASNYMEVILYADEETPGGKNYPPCEMMKVARWGNQTDTERQGCIYLSSTEGRIVRLTGVTKPIIERSNYGATFGSLPEFIQSLDLPVVEGQDYVYARGLVVQDIVRMDYQGKPVAEITDRGEWSEGAAYYCNALNGTTGVYETSDVWYMGCKWRCAKTGTAIAPAWNNTDWAMVEGNPAFGVDFEETDTLFDPDRFSLTLKIVATLYNQNVTADILDADVQWTRYSEDAEGNERTASDTAWALKRAGAGKSLALTTADCDFNGYVPRTIRWTATVTLRDGQGEEAATAQVSFEY